MNRQQPAKVMEFFLPPEAEARMREHLRASRTPAMDEFWVHELGTTYLSANDECLVCGEPALISYEQHIFRGPYGKYMIGRQKPEYVRTEVRQECNHCNVKLWKIPPEQFNRL